MRLVLIGTMPEPLLQDLLCILRTFESVHSDDVHLSIAVDAPTLSTEQVLAWLQDLQPPLPHITVKPRPEADDVS